MTVREAASRLNISIDFCYRLLWANKIKGHKPAREWLIDSGSVEKYLRERNSR